MANLCQPTAIQGCRPDPQGRIYTRCVKCGRVFGPHLPTQSPSELSSGNLAAIITTAVECPRANEQRSAVALPSYAAMAQNYAAAWIKHIATGRQVVSFADILATFRICSACEFYSDLSGQCGICGCYLNLLHGGQGVNMLEWANEECPHNPPFWKKTDRAPIKPGSTP